MTNASRDENSVPTLLGTLSTDGVTLTPIRANSSNKTLLVSNGSSGSDHGPSNASRDENSIPVLMAVSNVDGVTPVVIYADATGHLLVNNN